MEAIRCAKLNKYLTQTYRSYIVLKDRMDTKEQIKRGKLELCLSSSTNSEDEVDVSKA
jgi:hypothetical protein